jgi:hypothetical protein
MYDAAGISLDYHNTDLTLTCIDAANNIIDMAQTVEQNFMMETSVLQSPIIGNAMLTAATVFLWLRYCSAVVLDDVIDYDLSIAQAKVEFVLRFFDSWNSRLGIAAAWSDTLRYICKLYMHAYEGVQEDNNNNTTTNDASGRQDAQNSAHVEHDDRDGAVGNPDPVQIHQTMFDKVRQIAVTPLEDIEEKQRQIKAYVQTLGQHVWVMDSLEDLEG